MKEFIVFHPLAFALIVAISTGLILKTLFKKQVKSRKKRFPVGVIIRTLFSALAGFLVAALIVQSFVIALPFGLVTSCLPIILWRRSAEKVKINMQALWPEILDHLISGLQSGLSLAETVSALANRGPKLSQPIFKEFHRQLVSHGRFDLALKNLKDVFQDPIADQVCEVLLFARESGSRDTALTLRMLADFVRSDLSVRSEIAAKHGWVKNSAILAAVAPWILLIILASQPNTIAAYTSASGIVILLIGVALTGIAYFWMERVGRLPQIPRLFG